MQNPNPNFRSIGKSKKNSWLFELAQEKHNNSNSSYIIFDSLIKQWFDSDRTLHYSGIFYHPVLLLGEGRHGRVYIGITTEGKPVAVKKYISDDKDSKAYFDAEITFPGVVAYAEVTQVTTSGGCEVVETVRIIAYPLVEYNLKTAPKTVYNPKTVLSCVLANLIEMGGECPPDQYFNLHPRNILLNNKGEVVFLSTFGLISEFQKSCQKTTRLSRTHLIRDLLYLNKPDAGLMSLYSIGLLAQFLGIDADWVQHLLNEDPEKRILQNNLLDTYRFIYEQLK